MKERDSILVVDDDLDFLGIIRQILAKKGFEVETASSAGDALSLLKQRVFHVTILDISLPDADGTELLSGILGMQPDIIAIMLTGHSSVQNAVKSLNRGAFAYLEKPLDTENLISVINRGLEKQRLVTENRKLVEELERHNRITNTLLGVSQVVSQSLNVSKIINSALEKLAESTGMEVSFVYLCEKDHLKLAGHKGISIRMKVPGEIRETNGIFRQILEKAEPVIIEDLTKSGDKYLEFLKEGNYRCFAGFPMTVLKENTGIMGVASDFSGCFNNSNIELLSGIGREIAIAVRNAQLYEEASSAKALRELDTMRTEFLANVSHELRTPLAVIKGSANSLLQPDVIFDEQTRRDFLVSIDKDADTLTRLVEDLLMMSRLEADALEVRKSPHHLIDVVAAVKERLDNLTIKHRLHIDVPDKLPSVDVDDGRLGEVLTNLVENAVKFSEEDTNIYIKAVKEGNKIIVSVTDEGIGVPPELRDKVFERFFQGEIHKAGRRKGTGLGLSICKGIIEAHGGEIWVESKPGKGAKFSFSLPLS
jgi:K+-sensing histidine kinase KdpD